MSPSDWEWLKDLKVGDKVLMVRPGGRYRHSGWTDTVTVVKVGRARITVDDGGERWNSERVFRLTDQPGSGWPASTGHQEGERDVYLSLPSIERAKDERRVLDVKLRDQGGFELVRILHNRSTETAQKVYDLLQRED